MGKLMKTLLAGACATGLLLTGVASHADEIRERTLRFAFQNVKEHPQGQGAQKFADLLGEKSGGKIKVRLFPGGTLGGDVQTVSALQGGTLDITVLNSGILAAQAPDYAMLDFPFLFNNVEEAHAVIDGPVGQKLAAQLDSKGLVGLGYWDLGFRNLTNSKHPVTRLEDMQGLKIRVIQSPIYLETFAALGANPVPMAFPEVYTGLEQHTIDGQENPFTVIEGNKFYEVQKYLSVTGHIFNPQSLIISQKTWNRLNDDEKAMIRAAAAEAQTFQREVTAASMDKAKATLAAAMTVNEITPAEKDRLRERVKPVVDKFAKSLDGDLVKTMYEEIAKVRAAQ
ncbi:tripartite ATP-independent transporter solute receptor, DctP family [Pseudomonas sp. NFIX10]|uniref:TRAP transporter substrate-binding protein n=1 Tax=unclassified Pseudomonas TaxID=196821 RepID=UPI000871532D|nr:MULTISPECIES: TRAP transporter substrate-binding protein [unclassified Pseudomonas]SCW71553.1 tripartite ATP-independent transporter solute receptor, DctP family [Pseudomonas sp. NFACC56-3]SFB46919.1 tripartite ATP-independent transporter solute receptor, DctP family [Pseudomonas sp. NFIX10]SFF20378.1 tripartite ATP-independent transporter solute receptor, DctP family [Pseudomonas sp. NFACC06-1]SFL02376.1 tripartite ATP-independent transporter solute receptor, DctP family [Pseudomonas sp. NF